VRRHRTFEEDLAWELRNREFAATYFLTLMEGNDGLTLLQALQHTIYRMGVKEFSKKARIHPKSVSRMLASSSLPKLDTLDAYLAPFGLKARVVPERKAA
jgi:DNA-binding phage protein